MIEFHQSMALSSMIQWSTGRKIRYEQRIKKKKNPLNPIDKEGTDQYAPVLRFFFPSHFRQLLHYFPFVWQYSYECHKKYEIQSNNVHESTKENKPTASYDPRY